MKDKLKVVTTRLPESLVKKAKFYAIEKNKSLQQVIKEAIEKQVG